MWRGRERDRNEWEGVEGGGGREGRRGSELEDEEKIGKGGKTGVRMERRGGGGKTDRKKGQDRRLEEIRGRKRGEGEDKRGGREEEEVRKW